MVSRWSDNTPTEYEQKEEAEFGTPVAASQPPQYNSVSSSLRPLVNGSLCSRNDL